MPNRALPPELTSPSVLSALRLIRDPDLPIPLSAINNLSAGMKRRIYRLLLPPDLLARFGVHPINWRGAEREELVTLQASPGSRGVQISARHSLEAPDPFYFLELEDNNFNGLKVVWLVLNDPASPRFHTDRTVEGRETLFSTVNRNVEEEVRAMEAGLAPAQVRSGLRASRTVEASISLFAAAVGHDIYFFEPLTYVDAWLFERRGGTYIAGRQLMNHIHQGFQPGGPLHAALDGSTPFRQPAQAHTVRGRAWAIQDGILEAIGARWDGVRMAKRIGAPPSVNTFPDAAY